jgi:serine/threonine protein kinase
VYVSPYDGYQNVVSSVTSNLEDVFKILGIPESHIPLLWVVETADFPKPGGGVQHGIVGVVCELQSHFLWREAKPEKKMQKSVNVTKVNITRTFSDLDKETRESSQDCAQLVKHVMVVAGVTATNILRDVCKVLPNKADHLRLIDFGCAKAMKDDDYTRDMLGTPLYMAPELSWTRISDITDADPRILPKPGFNVAKEQQQAKLKGLSGRLCKAADVWSIGIMTYLFVVGQVPFQAPKFNEVQIMDKVLRGKWKLPKKKFSGALVDFLTKVLEYNPYKRLTALQALEHPWIRGDFCVDETLNDALMRLGTFQQQNKLRKVLKKVGARTMSEESRTHILKLFRQFDYDADGQLTMDEVSKLLECVSRSDPNNTQSAEQLRAVVRNLDENGDGVLSEEELLEGLNYERNRVRKEHAQELFDLFDKDHDGFLSYAEIIAMCGELFHTSEINALFRELDEDGDGKIDLKEWVDALTSGKM